MSLTASFSLAHEGAAAFNPDWMDFFSIQIDDVIESSVDHSFERKLTTSVDRAIERVSTQTIAKARTKEKSEAAYRQLLSLV